MISLMRRRRRGRGGELPGIYKPTQNEIAQCGATSAVQRTYVREAEYVGCADSVLIDHRCRTGGRSISHQSPPPRPRGLRAGLMLVATGRPQRTPRAGRGRHGAGSPGETIRWSGGPRSTERTVSLAGVWGRGQGRASKGENPGGWGSIISIAESCAFPFSRRDDRDSSHRPIQSLTLTCQLLCVSAIPHLATCARSACHSGSL
ncbi:hypothetical protein C8Q73DRAFT_90060 [Cubamyces lactineus]|nr:hypothetical protein C8Q73DRAFT_90060 [Cubamyces lactineus]